MKRIILMLTVAAMMVVALTVTAPMAFAAPFNDRTCDGTFTNDQGSKKCVQEDDQQAGNSNNKFEEETTQTRRGSETSPKTTTCTNPSGNTRDGECNNIK